jgi:hypothetical protein
MKKNAAIQAVLAPALLSVAMLLLPQSTLGQPALPKSPGAALRSGWQIAHFAVGYSSLAKTAQQSYGVETSFGTDEVHYYVLRKEGAFILCYSQLVMQPGAMRYEPWKHECMVIG